jgi:GNAT superfamily N-acetyltransferase
MTQFTPPTSLSDDHLFENFECGEPSLDEWLKKRALKNQLSGASRCFVLCHPNEKRVIGFYTLSAGAISHEMAPKTMRRNMPDPLPVMLLGRLAVDKNYHNSGLGSALLRDAILRVVNIANEAGVFAVLLHAISESAKQFYLSRGFVQSPIQSMTLMMTVETIRSILKKP